MLLAIDIGNSLTKFGLFEDGRLTKTFRIKTAAANELDGLWKAIEDDLPEKSKGVIISTVVNETIPTYSEFITSRYGVKPVFVDHSFDFGFSVRYFPPEDCGVDRLVAASAAARALGVPCLVCDFGTATTIDAVNEKREFVGGVITAGLGMLADGLSNNTSKLPRVELAVPDSVFGNTTRAAIQSGICYGYSGLVDGIIERMRSELGTAPPVLATGGFAGLISESSRFVNEIDPNLILIGLHSLFKERAT